MAEAGGDMTHWRRFALFTLASVHVVLCSGAAYGWTALRPVLQKSGLFDASDAVTTARRVRNFTRDLHAASSFVAISAHAPSSQAREIGPSFLFNLPTARLSVVLGMPRRGPYTEMIITRALCAVSSRILACSGALDGVTAMTAVAAMARVKAAPVPVPGRRRCSGSQSSHVGPDRCNSDRSTASSRCVLQATAASYSKP